MEAYQNDVISIYTVSEFLAISDNAAASYCLANDLDFKDISSFTPIGTEENPFSGTFDGCGHVIKNLTTDIKTKRSGLFGVVDTLGSVQNLRLQKIEFTIKKENLENSLRGESGDLPQNYTSCNGILAAENYGELKNCQVLQSSLYGDKNSSVYSGLCGQNFGTIDSCCAFVSVGAGGKDSYVGGIAGCNEGSIAQCWSDGVMFSYSSDNCYCGGLAGINKTGRQISDSFSRAGVAGACFEGGIVGRNAGGVNRCYAFGLLFGCDKQANPKCGGIAGYNQLGSVFTDCFWDVLYVKTSAASAYGPTEGAKGLEHTSLFEAATFTGFDFEKIWDISRDRDFGAPFLRALPFPKEEWLQISPAGFALAGKGNWLFVGKNAYPFDINHMEAESAGVKITNIGESWVLIHSFDNLLFFFDDGCSYSRQVEVFPEYGTEGVPFLLHSPDDMMKFLKDEAHGHYGKIENDMTLPLTWKSPHKDFYNHLDGGGHTLYWKGLPVESIFCDLMWDSSLRNVKAHVEGEANVFCGLVVNTIGEIENCSITYENYTLKGWGSGYVFNNMGTIRNGSVNGTIKGQSKNFDTICSRNVGTIDSFQDNVKVEELTMNDREKTMEMEQVKKRDYDEMREKSYHPMDGTAFVGMGNQEKEKTAVNDVTTTQMCITVTFKLLNTPLAATVESHADGGKELLIQPQYQYRAESFTLNDLLSGINEMFKNLTGGSAFQIGVDSVVSQLQNFLSNLSLDKLKITLKQVFVHVTKLAQGDTKLEYAFALNISSEGGAVPKDFTFASLESLSFGIWNTDNKHVLSSMGLLSIAQQLA